MNLFGFGKKFWKSMYDERKIHDLRMQFSSWFPTLRHRLGEGPIFQVHQLLFPDKFLSENGIENGGR